MERSVIGFLIVTLTVTSAIGAGIYYFQPDSSGLRVVSGSFNKDTYSVTLKIKVTMKEPVEIVTGSSALFSVEIIGDEASFWSISGVFLMVVTTHKIPAGVSYWDYQGSLIQTVKSLVPLELPEQLTIVVSMGEEYKSPPYTLILR